MNPIAILAAWVAANWLFASSLIVGLTILRIAYTQAMDRSVTWQVLGQIALKFFVVTVVLTMFLFGLINWQIPAIMGSISSNSTMQGSQQVMANTLIALQALSSPGSGSSVVQEMKMVDEVPASDLIESMTDGAEALRESVSEAANRLVAPLDLPATAPATTSPAPLKVAPAAPGADPQGPANPSYFRPAPNDPNVPDLQEWAAPPPAPVGADLPRANGQFAGPGGETVEQYKARVGQDGGGPQAYTVRSGDYMGKIAAQYGVSARALCDLNVTTVRNNCSLLRTGMVLIIPTN